VGQAKPVTTRVVQEVQALAKALEGVMADGNVSPMEVARIRTRVFRLESSAKFADSRVRLGLHVLRDVQDVANTDKRFALAQVPVSMLDDIGPEAA
jgi:hypothetical protein